MKLKHPDYEFELCFEDGKSTMLVIENPILLRTLMVDLINQVNGEDGLFVLSENSSVLQIKDNIDIIFNPLDFDVVSKKAASRINAMFKEHMVNEDNYSKSIEIISDICRYAEDIITDFPYQLKYDDISVDSLCKMINISVLEDYESELEKLLEHLNVSNDILGISCFIVVNINSFFSQEEIQNLVNECFSLKHNLLFICNTQCDYKIEGMETIIIDQDGCEIF